MRAYFIALVVWLCVAMVLNLSLWTVILIEVVAVLLFNIASVVSFIRSIRVRLQSSVAVQPVRMMLQRSVS